MGSIQVACYLLLHVLALVYTLDDFQEQCQLHCPLQNRTQDIHLEVECPNECKIKQCLRGCELWARALEASCQAVCNGTQDLLPPKELYCVLGCNDALNRYLQQLKDEMGTPGAPALVADSLTSSSVRLEWEEPKVPNLTYLVQWRYESAPTWQYCRNHTWIGHGSTVLVENLKPFTFYRFRVAILLPAHLAEPLVSEPSLVIGTLPGGPPSSPPSSVRAIATDPTRVSVSWKPGPFPNGPILSYVLSIDELPRGYKGHKDIQATENKEFYMFQTLLPSRNYSVSVAMRNAVGLGPAARTRVTTPPLSALKETEKTILVLAKKHTITNQTADSLYEPTIMYKTDSEIRGIALHVRKELLFISESSGHVFVTHLDPTNSKEMKVILSEENEGINFFPFSLSIDWLNDQLYVLGEVTDKSGGTRWQITRCGLDGSGLTVAVAGLLTKPLHIEVDPYNGYLFWVIQENSKKGGLYRLDLADISNGIKHEITPVLILNHTDLGAFTVDHSNFRILVPSHSRNTVLAVSLDGHEINDIRNNTQSPQFQQVMSLATANGLFYWTNGKSILTEEYHSGQNSYFHNVLLQGPMFVRVNLPSSQPVPVPVNPPTGLQAVLGTGVARTTWTMPHLLGGQGKGAWQNWSYQLSLYDTGDNISQEIRNINTTSFVVHNLQPATVYILRAAAYTSAGVGPWSAPFRGKTLSAGGSKATILWSGAEGLLMSDPTGNTVHTLIDTESLKDIHGEQHISDITWYKDQLFLVTNSSSIYYYNLTEKRVSRIRDIDSVGSIAVDWIGKKLYWSNPKQQLITRGNLNGTQQEPLPILTVAKELNVDALHGYIYWSTGHAVECAHLNGKQRKTYYPAELFSGKQVMGLTLDMSAKSIYWIVRNYEGSTLFRAEMAQELKYGQEIIPVKMSILQYPDMRGSLCYFDDHLLWLRDDSNAVIGDLTGRNLAILSGMSLTGLNAVTVMDNSLHSMPDGLQEQVIVIPDEITNTSLRVEGTYNSFNITWDPVHNINYGKIFYELKISHTDRKDIVVETTDSYWTYKDVEQVTPYSPLFVSVRSFTYWGGSPQVRLVLHSPPSTPSQPVNPRIFVSHHRSPAQSDTEIITTFRWDSPIAQNGVILSYKVLCWLDGSEELLCQSVLLSGTTMEYVTRDVPPNSTAFFQVLACTEVGCGVPSKAVLVNTGEESAVPRLLLSAQGILVMADCDKRENKTLSHTTGGHMIDVSYSFQENRVFWIDDNNQIMTVRLDTLQKNKMVNLNGTGLSIAVDWIGRFLYWSERSHQKGRAHIKSLDLNQAEKGNLIVSTILTRPATIYSLKIDPINSLLYWVEMNENKFTTLMKSKINGSNLQMYFGHNKKLQRRWGRGACNCPESPIVGIPVAIDHSSMKPVHIVWIDAATNNIISSDASACMCQVIVEAEKYIEAGLPPTSITVDHQLIFWSNETEGLVYGLPKSSDRYFGDGGYVRMIESVGIRGIVAFGPHLQPYPELHCLVPGNIVSEPKIVEKSNESITLELPEPQMSIDCTAVSLASVHYTVHYGIILNDGTAPCAMNIDNCTRKKTFERILKLNNLKPFTGYVFHITLENYYSKLAKIVPKPSLPVTFHTAAGAPSPPEKVTAIVLSPNSLQVSWSPSKIVNSQTVWYEVFWRSDNLIDGVRHKGERIVPESSNITTVRLDKLIPGQNYAVWVTAYSQSRETYSESSPVNICMYPEPENITLLQATAYSLNLSWHIHINITDLWYELQYSDASGEWQTAPLSFEHRSQEIYFLENLNPKTIYTFRLKIVYVDESDPYIWPQDNRFTFRTLGDKPSAPGVPVMQQLGSDIYHLTWEPSKDNGAPIDVYWLEGKKLLREEVGREKRGANFTAAAHYHVPTIIPDEWKLYYNGTDNYWIIKDLDMNEKYQFRVRSRNSYGWSDYSKGSSYFDLSKTSLLADKQDITLIILTLAIIVVMLTFMCGQFSIGRLRSCDGLCWHKKEKKALQISSTLPTTVSRLGSPDVELATLRELPRRSNFIQNSNALYTGADCLLNTDISTLPHLGRDQITLTKFLGSGAFGEVFEGKARSLPNSNESETRVAIKTLRKGATEQEKAEFLKEAQLMSNFKHPHILQLLGVCLDNDPNFIIMELMEGGDLLSYLRSSRPVMSTETSLTLYDLLSMSVDVARGCCYLEEMHFVHRDLACRNCLVSSRDPASRIVKIGDFGLARDIYKNDYYRKEGEGLLPVRWMAPESLVDGVFTSQSDVWAFGVLVWEIMALGQQPYPARNNLEVLHYVRNGGRLGQPVNSTPEMHELMLKCWSFNPDERPTFRYCLDVLEELKANSSALDSANNSTIRRNNAGTAPDSIPKYLELIYDGDGSGYEIPRSLEHEQPQNQAEEDISSLEKLLPNVKEGNVNYSNVKSGTVINEVVPTA